MTGTGNKYKIFRNFMVNELGITKEDIEGWAKEAVTEVAKKVLTEEVVKNALRNEIRSARCMTALSETSARKIMSEIIANEVTKDLVNKVKRNLDKLDKLEIEE